MSIMIYQGLIANAGRHWSKALPVGYWLVIVSAIVCLGCGNSANKTTTNTSTVNKGTIRDNRGNSASDGSSGSNEWVNNGAAACEKYLTPDVVPAILSKPEGASERVDAQSCRTTSTPSIYIHLKVKTVDAFRRELPLIAGTHPLEGVGDAAYWNQAGAISAVRSPNRGCEMNVVGAPYGTKIRDEELGQKLGEICNKLFALP